MLKIAYSPVYKYSLPNGHRFPMEKYELVPEQLLYEGTITREQFFHPDRLSEEEITLTHTSEYLDKLLYQNLSSKEIRRIGFPMRPALIDRGRYISMGTYQCALYAREFGISMNIAGGTHHAYADHGEGFCIFNDIAIASNLLIRDDPDTRILIIDLDVHQGNGTADIFKNDDRVFTFSVHGKNNYPHRKEKSDWDIPLSDGTGDREYLQVLQNALWQLHTIVKPDIIFYLSGADVLYSDKLGKLAMTLDGARRRDEMVFEFAIKKGIPVVVSMGGGYSKKLPHIIEAHSNTYRVAMGMFDG